MMIIGIPKERKSGEKRVALSPAQVATLVRKGCDVWVERGAGVGSGFSDRVFRQAGAQIVSRARVWRAGLIAKVKEPLSEEYGWLRPGQILFTFLHLSANRRLTHELLKRKVIGIGLETIRSAQGNVALAPMSRLAGALSIFLGQRFLFSPQGYGILLEHLPEIGAEQAHVVVLGAGMVGTEAARVASALRASVLVYDKDQSKLARLKKLLPTVRMTHRIEQVHRELPKTLLLIGAIYRPGDRPPLIIPKVWVDEMPPSAVTLDVAVDQGGCLYPRFVGSLDHPVHVDGKGRSHVRIPNMPALVPRTATFALARVTTPYLAALAKHGLRKAIRQFPELLPGVNVYEGKLTCAPVASLFHFPYSPSLGL